MLNSIRVFLTLIIVSTMALADVFITEIADPNNNASARFVELHNNGDDVDLTKLKVIEMIDKKAITTFEI